MPAKPRRGRSIPAFVACFYAGVLVGWVLRDVGKIAIADPAQSGEAEAGRSRIERVLPATERDAGGGIVPGLPAQGLKSNDRLDGADAGVVATTGSPAVPDKPGVRSDPIAELRRRHLRLPIDDAKIDAMRGSFSERRGGGSRGHEAVDILAKRNTPIHAVDDGTIARLFESNAGGLTIYQFDPTRRFNYYYAHLESYAPGLHDGQPVSRGEVIGYVGTSGNAPPNTPHLHFAISELGPERRWWEGNPLDPYLVFSN
jgi:murein DD-endopeptidase MepM/ murein hydrolase activator NlpD